MNKNEYDEHCLGSKYVDKMHLASGTWTHVLSSIYMILINYNNYKIVYMHQRDLVKGLTYVVIMYKLCDDM